MKDSKLQPWSEKYRPSKINDVIYHKRIINILEKYIITGRLPHLLFYGPPGTGKTSSIVAFAKQYYGNDFDTMTMILNASEERGIETVRNRIKQFVMTRGFMDEETTPKFKLVILDEIDAMTDDAQAILRKIIENYVKNVRFCFICNYLKKINPAIQSRCVIFRFNPIPKDLIKDYVKNILTKEKLNIEEKGIDLIINKSQGDMRKLMNILQSVNMCYYKYKNIDDKNISNLLSLPTENDIYEFIKYVKTENLQFTYDYLKNKLENCNVSIVDFINYMYDIIIENINNNTFLFDDIKLTNIIKNFSIINENIHYSNNENINIYAFVSCFYM